MYKTLLKSAVALMISLFAATSVAQTIRVGTYNIRYDNPHDSLDLWKNRYPYIAGLVKLYDLDIIGTQEGLRHQLDELNNKLEGFEYIGVGRDDGDQKGEYAAVFYRSGIFKLIESGNFWLSEITDRPNKGWDAALPRICTWGRFIVVSSGKEFYLFNTHFDHVGEQARYESARLIIEKIGEIAKGSPVILTGDFNFNEKHANYQVFKNSDILNDAYELAEFRYAPGGTFTAFNIAAIPEGRIDHIFVTKSFVVSKYAILTNTYNGRYPSDHFAVLSVVSLH